MTESPSPSWPAPRHPRFQPVGIALTLALLTGLAFFGVWKNEFIDYDDNTYVFLNPNISHGLNWQMIVWSFTETYGFNWHPLTWLTHGMDCQLYGLNPAGHHVTNLILHTANVVLLFFALRLMTGSLWRSALLAALFGVHPLRVESVAWVAERKDVLSGFFFLLTLIAYARFVQQKEIQPSGIGLRFPTSRYYWLTLLCFALGLMSKPMLVTMPFVLLLVDYWPFQRFDLSDAQKRWDSFAQLTTEKIPFFLLTIASSVITVKAQASAMATIETIPMPQRLGNAVQVYVAYLQQILWPHDLGLFYPQPALLLGIGVLGAVAILAIITVLSLRAAKQLPWVMIGWLIYLGMLIPVIGIIQVGLQAQADRYTYLPSIGIGILVVWGVAALVAKKRTLQFVAVGVAVAAVLALGAATRRQVTVWRNTETLFAHAAKVTQNNYVALTSLAGIDIARGRIQEATTNVEQALKIAPKFPRARYLMGVILQMQGRMQEAIPHLEAATGVEVGIPGKARLVLSYIDGGRFAEADLALAEVFRAFPNSPDAWLMRAALLKEQGQAGAALEIFRKVVAVQPPPLADNPTMNFELAELFGLAGENQKAVAYYEKALAISPQHANALNNYAWLLATDPDDRLRNGLRAVELAERACQATRWEHAVFLGTLAAAYAEAGQFDNAVKMAERARDKARTEKLEPVARRNEELLELYRQGKPWREKAG